MAREFNGKAHCTGCRCSCTHTCSTGISIHLHTHTYTHKHTCFSALKNWKGDVDFVVANGMRAVRTSTLIDMTAGDPTLLRAGEGSFEKVLQHYPPIAGEPQ